MGKLELKTQKPVTEVVFLVETQLFGLSVQISLAVAFCWMMLQWSFWLLDLLKPFGNWMYLDAIETVSDSVVVLNLLKQFEHGQLWLNIPGYNWNSLWFTSCTTPPKENECTSVSTGRTMICREFQSLFVAHPKMKTKECVGVLGFVVNRTSIRDTWRTATDAMWASDVVLLLAIVLPLGSCPVWIQYKA